MKLYVDNKNRIMAVNATDRTDLREFEIDETEETFPFSGWNESKILCYKVNIVNGKITMFTPYIDTSLFGALEKMKTDEVAVFSKAMAEMQDSREENGILKKCLSMLAKEASVLSERHEMAETSISALTDYSADLLYKVCLLKLGITEDEI